MKCVFNRVALLAVVNLALSACGPVFAPGGGKYQQGIWIKVELAEPVHFNQPVNVTITVETEKDESGLRIGMDVSHPDIVLVEGEHRWVVVTQAGRPVQVTSTIRFTREGWYNVIGGAFASTGHASHSVYVHVTQAGGTVNPKHTLPAGPAPAVPYGTPLPVTPAPTPEPQPTSRDIYIPPLPPEELLARCGWPPGRQKLTPWSGAKAGVNIPETVPPNTPVPITLGVELKTETTAVRLKLALCRPDPAVQVEGQREWEVTVEPGVPTVVSTTLRFTTTGEFAVIAGAYDPTTGRVISGGRWVLASSSQPRTSQTGWITVFADGFEGNPWPGSGWQVQDLSNDGFERYWTDNDYRAHEGSWAAWPAAGGRHAIYPQRPYGPEYYYPNNMDTRMIYGPFDLRDAVLARTSFWLWRRTEPGYDYLAFEVSPDGVAFRELASWNTSATSWTYQCVYYNDYVGDDSVWVAWRFHSDSSITRPGPWVDDIRVWKYVPVTIQGSLHYYDRNGLLVPARYTRVHLYDADSSDADDLLGETTTDANGFWQFGPLRNWDDDDSDPDSRLDLYVTFETDVYDSGQARRRVTDYSGATHGWRTATYWNVAGQDGIVDVGPLEIPFDNAGKGAIWLFQDLRRAWEYIWNQTGTDPGPASVKWQPQGTGIPPVPQQTCYWYGPPVEGILIMDPHQVYSDVVIHELGHGYMYNAYGSWFWADITEWFNTCRNHYIYERTGDTCAWTEGWADLLAVTVNGDPELDWPGGSIGNLETATSTWGPPWAQGDECEGRVAAALYDLFDSTNDGLDQASFGFRPIWNMLRNPPHEQNFREFWNNWKAAGYERHYAVLALYQNTINYNTAPTIDLPNTPVVVLQGHTRDNAIDLWACSADPETPDAQLTWQIVGGAGGPCGPRLDGRYVDLDPQAGWTGSCNVTIQVSDGISTAQDTFVVQVRPIVGRAYLPLALKGSGGVQGALPMAATPTPGVYPAPPAGAAPPTPTATPKSYPAP